MSHRKNHEQVSISEKHPRRGIEVISGEHPQIDADLRFVFAIHTPEYVGELADAMIRGGEILALENVGSSDALRGKDGNTLNSYANGGEVTEGFVRWLEDVDGSNPFWLKFVKALKDCNRRIELVDVSENDPEWEIVEDAHQSQEDLLEEMLFEDYTSARQAFCEDIELQGKANRAREAKVIRQLHDIAEEDGGHPSIAIFSGAAHTPIYHQLSRDDKGERSREFVPVKEGSLKMQLTQILAAQRFLRAYPDRELPEDLLDRAMLEWYLNRFSQEIESLDTDTVKQYEVLHDVLTTLGKKGVYGALAEFDALKEKYGAADEDADDEDRDFTDYYRELHEVAERIVLENRKDK